MPALYWTLVALDVICIIAGVTLAFLTRKVTTLFNESKVRNNTIHCCLRRPYSVGVGDCSRDIHVRFHRLRHRPDPDDRF